MDLKERNNKLKTVKPSLWKKRMTDIREGSVGVRGGLGGQRPTY